MIRVALRGMAQRPLRTAGFEEEQRDPLSPASPAHYVDCFLELEYGGLGISIDGKRPASGQQLAAEILPARRL